MKYTGIVVILLFMGLFFVGCTGQSTPAKPTTPNTTDQTIKSPVVSIPEVQAQEQPPEAAPCENISATVGELGSAITGKTSEVVGTFSCMGGKTVIVKIDREPIVAQTISSNQTAIIPLKFTPKKEIGRAHV